MTLTRNTNMNLKRAVLIAGVIASGLSLTGCMNLGYRCPMDPSAKPDSPTACTNMHDAMNGARNNTGGQMSVVLDDKGRLVPKALTEGKPLTPMAAISQATAASEPYRTASGEPVFEQPRVYRAWTPAFVDGEGNLHDGHHTWFATPGRWAYGNLPAVNSPGVAPPGGGGAAVSNLMKPALPGEGLPPGRQATQVKTQQQPPAAQPTGEKDAAAMRNLSAAAINASGQGARPATTKQAAIPGSGGVTQPALQLRD